MGKPRNNGPRYSQFASKPRFVQAVQVSAENMVEIANWTGGEIVYTKLRTVEDMSQAFKAPTLEELATAHVKVKTLNPRNDRQTEAHVGDWVLRMGKAFKVYTDDAFKKSYDEVLPAPKVETIELEDIGTPLYDAILGELQKHRSAAIEKQTQAIVTKVRSWDFEVAPAEGGSPADDPTNTDVLVAVEGETELLEPVETGTDEK